MGRVLGELVYNLIKREDVLKIPEAIFEEHLVLKWSYLAKAAAIKLTVTLSHLIAVEIF